MDEQRETSDGQDAAASDEVISSIGENSDRSCCIIGPANSGKTTLLLAMQQACLQNELEGEEADEKSSRYKLDFVPESETAADLMSLAGEFLFHGKTVQASREVVNYEFRIFANNLTKKEQEYSCRLVVTDGPGGYLFPREHGSTDTRSRAWNDLLHTARQASSLVLCVDGSAPALETLYHGLPRLIHGLKAGAPRLPYRRVLLLVTKIDGVVNKFAEAVRDYRQFRRAHSTKVNPILEVMHSGSASYLSPAKLARMIHPLQQTRHSFGRLIDMLQSGLDGSATFAVGICSAWGLESRFGGGVAKSRRTFAEDDVEESVWRFQNWEPFGVREAILFLVADEIRHPLCPVPKIGAGRSADYVNVRVPLNA